MYRMTTAQAITGRFDGLKTGALERAAGSAMYRMAITGPFAGLKIGSLQTAAGVARVLSPVPTTSTGPLSPPTVQTAPPETSTGPISPPTVQTPPPAQSPVVPALPPAQSTPGVQQPTYPDPTLTVNTPPTTGTAATTPIYPTPMAPPPQLAPVPPHGSPLPPEDVARPPAPPSRPQVPPEPSYGDKITSWWDEQSPQKQTMYIGGAALALGALAWFAFGRRKMTPNRAAPPRRPTGEVITLESGARWGHTIPPKEYRAQGATRKSDYAWPAGYKYPLVFRRPDGTVDVPKSQRHVRSAAAYFARFKDNYPPRVRREIATNINKAKKRFDVGGKPATP